MKKIYLFIFIVIFIMLFGTTSFLQNETNCNKIIFNDVPNFVSFSESEGTVKSYLETIDIDKVSFTIKGKTDFKYDIGEVRKDMTAEEVDKIKKDRLQAASEYYENFNKALYELLPSFAYDSIYISKYFGSIDVVAENNIVFAKSFELLKRIANIDLVENIFVYTSSADTESYIKGAQDSINLSETIRTNTGDGSGINVGLLDEGIVDTSLSVFDDVNIVCRNHWLYIESISEHSTSMAVAITGEYGMASKCNLYSVELFGNFSGELDWLVDQNVDVINMSFGYNDNPGTYDQFSAMVDELIWTYGITCCIAAGNANSLNNYYITNPALAYNAITVGAGGHSDYMDILGCYDEYTEIDKPTIISHSEIMLTGSAGVCPSGSSGATALTTGVVAGLMKRVPYLKLQPAMVTALIAASSYAHENFIFSCDSNLNHAAGAGFLDADNAHDNIANCHSSETTSSQVDGSIVFEYEEFFLAGENIRIAASWLVKSSGTVASLSYSDYDLCIFRPEGGQIDCTMSAYNNLEMLNITIPYAGTYTIRVVQCGSLAHTDATDICVAWTYDTENGHA